jgi:hypothetical protein
MRLRRALSGETLAQARGEGNRPASTEAERQDSPAIAATRSRGGVLKSAVILI